MFEPVASYSMPAHLYLVSEWSALCTSAVDPMTCSSYMGTYPFTDQGPLTTTFTWTDLTYLLHRGGVSWGYYVVKGDGADCLNPNELACVTGQQSARTGNFWNPLPGFATVKDDGELGNIQSVDQFYAEVAAGTLPTVSWVAPSAAVAEHPPNSVSDGQAYVTSLINAIMSNPTVWASSVIFLAWNDGASPTTSASPP